MHEAVEIAKLRLFLKLAAQVKPNLKAKNMGLEPLPDVDFNIRCGNTLVGFVNQAELTKAYSTKIEGAAFKEKIETELEVVSKAYQRFKEIQLGKGEDFTSFKTSKTELQIRLNSLNYLLNELQANLYGIHRPNEEAIRFQDWKESHQPFHWIAEYYAIIQGNKGFDVIIGNPPYVVYGTKLKAIYTLKDYSTLQCGNLHAFVAERCFKMNSVNGFIGLIIPLPAISTSSMESLQSIIKPIAKKKSRNTWISAFDERPSSLFDGVDQRLIIEIIGNEADNCFLYTTGIKRWYSSVRENLFPSINYSKQSEKTITYTPSILKIQNGELETGILSKFYSNKPVLLLKSKQATKNIIYYRTAGGRYWKVFSDTPSGTETVSEKGAYFTGLTSYQAVALFSSSTFWWYYSCHFDMFNLKDYMIFGFRFSNAPSDTLNKLSKLGTEYLKSLEQNAEIKKINSKTKGLVEQKQFVINKSKSIIDEIDKVLAHHYNFTSAELDFIINYDVKNRMGNELNEDE